MADVSHAETAAADPPEPRDEPVTDIGAAHGISCRAPRCLYLVREVDGAEVCRASIPRSFHADRALNIYAPSRLLPAPMYWCAAHPAIKRLIRRLYQESESDAE